MDSDDEQAEEHKVFRDFHELGLFPVVLLGATDGGQSWRSATYLRKYMALVGAATICPDSFLR